MLGPPLLIGDHVAYSCDSGAFLHGTVRWMGRVAPLYGQQMVVGIELVSGRVNWGSFRSMGYGYDTKHRSRLIVSFRVIFLTSNLLSYMHNVRELKKIN